MIRSSKKHIESDQVTHEDPNEVLEHESTRDVRARVQWWLFWRALTVVGLGLSPKWGTTKHKVTFVEHDAFQQSFSIISV